MRLSIRYKVLAIMALIAIVSLVAYLGVAVSLFTKDKLAYAYDLNAVLVSALREELTVSIASEASKLRYVLDAVQNEDLLSKRKSKRISLTRAAPVLRPLFDASDELLAVEVFKKQRKRYLSRLKWINDDRARDLGISSAEFASRRDATPIPWETVESQGLVVFDSGVSTETPVVSLAVGRGSLFARVELRPDRWLKMLGRTGFYRAYVVDEKGNIVLHNDPEALGDTRSFVHHPVVREALTNPAAVAVQAFERNQRDKIGGFARVDEPRLVVVTEIDREAALLANRELIRSSSWLAVAILSGVLALSVFFARRLTGPVRLLELATRQLAQGNFAVSVPVQGNDEVGVLAKAFNGMAKNLLNNQRELQSVHEQLIHSEKLATMGELSAALSHEAKNPITGMRGLAQLGKIAQSLEEAREYFELIEAETARGSEILDNFLRAARGDSEFVELDVNDVVRDVARLLKHQLMMHEIRLEVRLGSDLPIVQGNANMLLQVFLNLGINAQHAMEGMLERKLEIATRPCEVPEGVEIVVTDSGCGMDEITQARLFEPFFTTKGSGKGTGLGLSISRRIVFEHQGNIQVSSRLGEGTAFSIYLPSKEMFQDEQTSGFEMNSSVEIENTTKEAFS